MYQRKLNVNLNDENQTIDLVFSYFHQIKEKQSLKSSQKWKWIESNGETM